MLHFTLKQLRYVEAAGRLGSISAAAAELNISQSSITAAIDALEAGLGFDLFVRTPAKGLRATPSGAEALEHIRLFLDQARHFEADIRSLGGAATGTVRIACYVTAAPSFLPPILKSFADRFPGISVQLLEGHMERVMEYLDAGLADLAFTYDEMLGARHEFRPLFAAPPYALVAAHHPLAARASVSLADLADQPMIMLDLPRTRAYFTRLFEDRGLSLRVEHTTRSAEMTRALVAGGFGFTVLNICPPDYRAERAPFRALPIDDELATPIFGIATQGGTRLPRIVSTFIEHCEALNEAGVFAEMTVT